LFILLDDEEKGIKGGNTQNVNKTGGQLQGVQTNAKGPPRL